MFQLIVWDVGKGEALNVIDCHPDVIYSMSFNRDGSRMATTCKDKKLRIIDPRTGFVISVSTVPNTVSWIFLLSFYRYLNRKQRKLSNLMKLNPPWMSGTKWFFFVFEVQNCCFFMFKYMLMYLPPVSSASTIADRESREMPHT